ncbi:multidrug efflux MFS transporter permease subunit VceB [soil metagenome]
MSSTPPASASAGGGGLVPSVAPVEPPPQSRLAAVKSAAADAPFTCALLWGTGILLALANFRAVLDTTITNVSVPNIAGGLAVSPSQGTWTITSYSVAEAITVPLTGWLAARFGTVTTFVTAVVLFGVFSFACGFAPSLGTLVFFRICQGLAGGPMIPLSQTLLLRIFPKHLSGQAIALWSMTTVVAPIAGPLLGGAICDNVGWPWIFYINVPVAAGLAYAAWSILKKHETPGVKAKVDGVGLGLLVIWISCLQIALDKGKELDWFNSPLIGALITIAIIGFAAFLIWELTDKNPVVNLRIFRNRGFATATAVMAISFGGFFAANVLLPLWMQTNLGYNATWAGRVTAFGGIMAVIMSPVAGRMVSKVDPRLMIACGLGWMGMTMLWRSGFASNVDFFHLIVPQFLQGIGVPFFFVPLMSLGTGSLPQEEIPAGAGLISFVRTTAGAFGVSLITTKWEDAGESARVALLNQRGGGYQAGVDSLVSSGLSPEGAVRQFEALLQNQAVMVGTNQMFMWLAAFLLLACAVVWIAPRPAKRVMPPGAGGH